MRKNLLKIACILFFILFIISLLFVGYKYGKYASSSFSVPLWHFLVPASYLVLFGVGCYQVNDSEFGNIKGYGIVALIVLISVLLYRDPQISGEKVYPLYFKTRLVLSALVMVIHVAGMVIGYREDKIFRESISEGYRPGEEAENGKIGWTVTKEISTKKMIGVTVALVIALSAFFWYKDKHEPTMVELTMENAWEYLAIDYVQGYVNQSKDDALECSISGVLSHAVYEDVVLTFQVQRYPNKGEEMMAYEVRILLNAAGEAEFKIYTSGLAIIQNGKGECDYQHSGHVELHSHNRDLQLKSVEGKVIYGP